jgi:hypothetical protein
MEKPLEIALEEIFQHLIQSELADSFPVFCSSQSNPTGDIECVVITVTKEGVELTTGINPLREYTAEIQLWSVEPSEDTEEMHRRWAAIDAAMMSDDVPNDCDLSAVDTLAVFETDGKSETEIDDGGRRTRTRTYRVHAQAAAAG